jgi:phospholipid transport system substrate-binding protein
VGGVVKIRLLLFLLVVLICQAAPVFADDPQATLKAAIDKGIAILKDPQYQGTEKQEIQREKFWTEIRQMFDFDELSRRALARNWRRFSPDEKKRFTKVFSELLGNTYVEKIQREFQNQEVVYVSQERVKETRAIVKTKVVKDDIEIPIDYRLHNKKGPWKVYDVYVEGVSLVQNYRTQFNKVLINQSPEQLIQRLQKKVEGLKS